MNPPLERRTQFSHWPLAAWLIFFALCASYAFLGDIMAWTVKLPDTMVLPVDAFINIVMDWIVANFRWLFQAIAWAIEAPMVAIQKVLLGLPWPVTAAFFTYLALVSGGRGLAIFTLSAQLYLVAFGYWVPSMNTLTLIFVAVPLAAVVGLMAGIGAFKSPRINAFVTPILDIMQTVPMFAYLIPFLLLFGFGPAVGIVATAIYACPPMVRNVALGLKRVAPDLVDSGRMSGATNLQLMWHVQLPSASASIMMGLNQTIMQALNMVIIAAVIGSTVDMGWEVLSALRKAQFGESLFAGVVVVFLAIIIDRISRGFAKRAQSGEDPISRSRAWKSAAYPAIALLIGLYLVYHFVPAMDGNTKELRYYPAEQINAALNQFLVLHAEATEAIKKTVLFYFLFPLKLGFANSVKPFTWGFAWAPMMTGVYLVVFVLAALVLGYFKGWSRGVGLMLGALVLLFGLVNVPWILFVLAITIAAWQIADWKIAIFSFCSLMFMVLSGVWAEAINSIYLCGASVLFSFASGSVIGAWAAHDDRVSAFLKPVVDTLQTMPLFVFLIPILMFFQVGELPAFLAITAYSVVAAIRYVEFALRNVPYAPQEAARVSGCTAWQLLWNVKVPLALPEILLGLNQTIMFALQMLAISALVGSRELGQALYVALSNANAGEGIVAGLSIAFIAMVSDRIIQAWSARQKAKIGMT